MLNSSSTPPLTIEDKSDGKHEIPVKDKLILRHKVTMTIRNYKLKPLYLENRPLLEIF